MTKWEFFRHSVVVAETTIILPLSYRYNVNDIMNAVSWFAPAGLQLSAMRLQSLFYSFFVLTANFSAWSWEVNQYHWTRSDNDELLCGMSPANETLEAVGSSLGCISSCFHVCPSSPCQAVNYWTNARLCQHFYYIPCSYDVQQDCISYQVAPAVCLFLDNQGRRSLWDRGDTSPQYLDRGHDHECPPPQYF